MIALRLKCSMLFSAELDELVGAGNLALCIAAGRFQALNGCKFSTYAFSYIRGYMLRSFTRVDGHHDSAQAWEQSLTLDAVRGYSESPETPFYRAELSARVWNAVAQLGGHQRAVIESVYSLDVPLTVYARSLGCKRDRVMKWKRSAVLSLRRSLGSR
jgi:RNA polymerase sigma factor (sigma-70 family)